MAREFVPFGGEQAGPSEAPKFVRREVPGLEPDELDIPSTAPVTPAEAVDLAGQIRQILQKNGLSSEATGNVVAEIETAIAAAPARVALPEIKITAPTPPEAQPDADAPKLATIDYEREEDIIKRIRVGCTCGETILLDCDY